MSAADGRALTALTAARLVILDGDTVEGDSVEVEIVHEVLVRKWPRLREWFREWLEDNRAWLHTRDRLVADAGEWDRDGREQAHLYRGLRLAVAESALQEP